MSGFLHQFHFHDKLQLISIILQLESLTAPASLLARTSDLGPASDKTVTSSGLVCKAASQPLLTSLAVVWIPILVFTLITGKTVSVCEKYMMNEPIHSLI